MSTTVTAFEGHRRIASGELSAVAVAAKAVVDRAGGGSVLIFDDRTSAQVEIDFRGSVEDLRARLTAATPLQEPARRGRPKLGVTAREVTLLPRQWEWLNTQPGGASATLRRLIDQARKQDAGAEVVRAARDALYRFMHAIAGDVAGYEDALRALFAGQSEGFIAATANWPADVRDHAWRLAPMAFGFQPSPLDAAIPFDRRAAVQRAVDAAFPGQEISASAPVVGGASGARVFRLTLGDQDRLLRLEGARDALRDPARQYACMKIAAAAGVAPRLIYADVQDGVAITDFIQVSPPDPSVSRESRLRAIGQAIATLHAAPRFPGLVDVVDGVAAVIAQAEALNAMPKAGTERMRRLFAELARIYPRDPADQVSSHNDLNPTNLLFEGERVWIVDWESAFAADRYMDLAAVANFFAADETEEEQVLEAYFGAVLSDHHRAKLVVMQQLNRLFYAAMLLSAAVAAQPDLKLTPADLDTPRYSLIRAEAASIATTAGKARFACAFLNEADHACASLRFAWAVERLNA
jgi:aminoglycoside phosphotransferase (APT) family kinase protein